MAVAGKKASSDRDILKTGPKEDQLDINQFELALINRALNGERIPEGPFEAQIGNSERILRIQKRNLSSLLRSLGKPNDPRSLEKSLRSLLNGKSTLRLMGLAPKHDH